MAQDKAPAMHEPFFIGIAGGTASGKSTVCKLIIDKLQNARVALISLDEFYRDLTEEEARDPSKINFDEPSAFDVPSMVDCLDTLRRFEKVDVPVYDFNTSRRSKTEVRVLHPADVIIVEGILVLHIPELLSRFQMKVFVDTDPDVRLSRRIQRDTVNRGRNITSVLSQYERFVKPAFQEFVLPSKLKADVIIPWEKYNDAAVELIAGQVKRKLEQAPWEEIFPHLHIMQPSSQTRGLHTMIRDKNTGREDFVFYSERLMRLVMEAALGMLPFESERNVLTPTGHMYQGVGFSAKICGVSVIPSGEAMEGALRDCLRGVRIGKILVERSGNVGYWQMPVDAADRHILLMEPVLATGSSMLAAIKFLVEKQGVSEAKLVVVSLLASLQAVKRICKAYPLVRVVISEMDRSVGDDGMVLPGFGDFAERFYGCGIQKGKSGGEGCVDNNETNDNNASEFPCFTDGALSTSDVVKKVVSVKDSIAAVEMPRGDL
eukprot:CAMPEP_0206444872 /NCGR_PEP_ID=MMETSP0324_2-20121206/15161_1 /ASSEMBLY_ACC=CAM_ASM_000836 /TAXON_ID=2866 /ORGANISM="Crypthecodinium cohnii, Strain Seligo" /LENGTH=489 /DNA_ID=CAMNT_0053912959 /DNA_START=68 /DNA_END=1537 /DNA_ORIENTATION=-